MGSTPEIIVPLKKAESLDINLVGSKTRNISIVLNKGFKVPSGFCITTAAYSRFINENKLFHVIDMEIFRKPFEDMRWEEIWDASLRIRSAFLKAEIPPDMELQIRREIKKFSKDIKFSIRSSSPAEDSSVYSFAGIHESYTNISGIDDILESIKLVWASLWSDRAILYREELSLDSFNSSIAVLVQIMEKQPLSGLAFSTSPTGNSENLIIEVVGGFLSKLVDNEVEPEKWIIQRNNLNIIEHTKPPEYKDPLLNQLEMEHIGFNVLKIEKIFKHPVDIEWTGTAEDFTILQVRPITSLNDEDKDRKWYLTLTPTTYNLKALSDKVEKELIPELEEEGKRLSGENPDNLSRMEIAAKIKERAEIYFKWKDIYWNDFIPFAHGIRNFGTYYNDIVKPDNPYEFIEILKDTDLLATKRNKEFQNLARSLNKSFKLKSKIKYILENDLKGKNLINELLEVKQDIYGGNQFITKFLDLLDNYMDISYDNRSMKEFPEVILKIIFELSKKQAKEGYNDQIEEENYLDKLYLAAGKSRRKEVDETLRIAKLSWKLRDDDNILFGKIENQLLIFLNKGADILLKENRLDSKENITPENWKIIYKGLLDKKRKISLNRNVKSTEKIARSYKPRQLIGQPSSQGIVTGKARIINSLDDFSKFKSGEVLVCDAVQPQMTFLVSLASGIVERRGGMLVHSSIIAREFKIPAVNGVSRATELINNGDLITVNGYLGLVIIGEPEFNLEYNSTKVKV